MADSSELNALRADRINQLKNQQASGPSKEEEMEERRSQAEQMKHQILSQVLDQPARARLNTLMLAKPEKGQAVENLLMNMARMGKLRAKISEDELIGLLEQVSKSNASSNTTVKFDRRRCNIDDDDDEDYLDL